MTVTERDMIHQTACDVFAVAEREAIHMAHTRDLLRRMADEEFPMNRRAA